MRTHNLMLCQQENPPLRALRMSMPMSRRIYALRQSIKLDVTTN